MEKVKPRFLRNNRRLRGWEEASPVSLALTPVLLEGTRSVPQLEGERCGNKVSPAATLEEAGQERKAKMKSK